MRVPSGPGTPPVVRPLRPGDLPAAFALSKSVGWPHRIEDWDFLVRCGTGMVALDGAGRVIGTVLWWRFGSHARIGLLIVDGLHQRRGIGRRLMRHAFDALPGCVLGLCATEAGIPLYRTFGFTTLHRIEQHQGISAHLPTVTLPTPEQLRPIAVQDIATITALDASATGAERSPLIGMLAHEANGVAIDTPDGVHGYAFCRRFGRGWLIGPVGACDEAAAQALIAHWLIAHRGDFIRIDIPAGSSLSNWLAGLGLTKVDTIALMTTSAGAAPYSVSDRARMRCFALCAQSIG